MRRIAQIFAAGALALALSPAARADAPAVPTPLPTPGEIVAAAPGADWAAIAPSDLLVMELTPDAAGRPRRVVIELMPAPFSGGWIGNIRKLAAAHWWDGTSINRVQDNYVVQWGDATEKKPLPGGLASVPQSEYGVAASDGAAVSAPLLAYARGATEASPKLFGGKLVFRDNPGQVVDAFFRGFPYAGQVSPQGSSAWPIHCYGSVGVGRAMPPDTGSGAELYAVIGQAPRQLDRNIAVVGRVIEGIEFLSSLPRGTGPLGFYETPGERVPIVSIRLGDQVPGLPAYQYLSTESASFARYADARANRRDAFFIVPAGGADICNVPVPVRRAP